MNGWTKAFGIVILFAAAVFLFAVAMAKTDGMAIASISLDTFLADETYEKCTKLAGGLVAIGGICSIAAGSKYRSAFVCVLGALVALIGASFLMVATGNIDFSEKNVDIFLGSLFGITALVGISYATSRKSAFGFIIFVILFLLAIVFKGEDFDGKIISFAGHGFPLYCFSSEMFMPILGMLIAFFVGVYFVVCSMRDTKDAKKKAAAAAEEESAEEVIEEAPAEETAEETPAEEVVAEEAPAEEAPAEAAAGVAAEAVAAEETAEEAPAEETPAETAVEETPAEEVAAEEVSAEEAPAEAVAAEETAEEAPAEETPAETAVEETPAEEVATEEAPAEEAPAEEIPAEAVAAAVAVGVAAEEAPAEEEVPALPAIKSSQDAAAAAAAVRAENEERLSDEATEDGENIPEEEAPAEDEEEMLSLEDLGLEPDTPETFVRRAAWNKGLRCRRDYGKHKIPVAFVKGKVAVFVDKGEPMTSKDEVLAKEGWTVFHFPEADIVDGAAEAEIVAKAVKENLKASKKKRKTTKR